MTLLLWVWNFKLFVCKSDMANNSWLHEGLIGLLKFIFDFLWYVEYFR